MSSSKQNQHIARLIIGAMTIDGEMSDKELAKCGATLEAIGMGQLVAYLGSVLQEDESQYNMFQECKDLVTSLGSESKEVSPLVFRIVVDVVAADRFVSLREASYLAAMAKRLDMSMDDAKSIFKTEMARQRSRLEVSGSEIDEALNKNLKDLLSFKGADDIVGELDENALEEMLHQADEGSQVCKDEVSRAMTILGLQSNSTIKDADKVCMQTIHKPNVPQMAELGETFVSAAIDRITAINNAYKTVLAYTNKK